MIRVLAPLLASIVLAWLSPAAPLVAQEKPATIRLPPVDEAAEDPDLFSLRARLLKAIGERDVESIVAAATDDVCLSFGGFAGRDRLRELLENDATGEYWGEFAAALALGGVFVADTLFSAPYLAERFPYELDAFEGLVAIGSSVPARVAPDPDSRIVRTLDWEVVLRDREADRKRGWPEQWVAVTLADETTAWVRDRDVRSPIGYRVMFLRRDGRWWIDLFLAGD